MTCYWNCTWMGNKLAEQVEKTLRVWFELELASQRYPLVIGKWHRSKKNDECNRDTTHADIHSYKDV